MDNEQSTIYFEDTYTYTSFIFLICTLLVYIFGLFIAKNQFPASIFIAILSNSIFVGLVTIIYLLVNYKKEIETRNVNYIDHMNRNHIIFHVVPLIVAFFFALFQNYFVNPKSYNLWISFGIVLFIMLIYSLIPTVNNKYRFFEKVKNVYMIKNKKEYFSLISIIIVIIIIILVQQGRIVSKSI
jgi:hypothetical protein